jgi:hypothetical protein
MNPFKVALFFFLAFVALFVLFYPSFSKAGVEDVIQLSENVVCLVLTTKQEVSVGVDKVYHIPNVDVLEDIRPFNEYDGYLKLIETTDGVSTLREWMWKDNILCERNLGKIKES